MQKTLGVFRRMGKHGGRVEPVDKKARHEFAVADIDAGGAADGELVVVEPIAGRALGPRKARITERIGRSAAFVYVESFGLTPTQFLPRLRDQRGGVFAASQTASALGSRFGMRRWLRWRWPGLQRRRSSFSGWSRRGGHVAVIVFMLVLANACLGPVLPTTMVLALDLHPDMAGLASSLGGAIQIGRRRDDRGGRAVLRRDGVADGGDDRGVRRSGAGGCGRDDGAIGRAARERAALTMLPDRSSTRSSRAPSSSSAARRRARAVRTGHALARDAELRRWWRKSPGGGGWSPSAGRRSGCSPIRRCAGLAEEELARIRPSSRRRSRRCDWRCCRRDAADERSAILEVRAGTGGEEAALFAADLARMTGFAEARGWRWDVVEEAATELGGYRELVAEVWARASSRR